MSKRKETSAVLCVSGPNVAPLTVRRISSLHVMNSRRTGCFIGEDRGRRLTAATKTVFLIRRRKRSKHEEIGGADFLLAYWVNARTL